MDEISGTGCSSKGVLQGRKMACARLGDVLVLGLGVSGKAASDYLAGLLGDRVETLTILGGKSDDAVRAWADELVKRSPSDSLSVFFDEEDASRALPEGVSRFDLCIASPGISYFSDMYQDAKRVSVETISEVEFAWRESPADSVWAAITGTNGKTTTTSLLNHILQNAGRASRAVGNIGKSCIAQVSDDLRADEGSLEDLVYVAEVSSYQLASIADFAPNVAIVLGITPDHLKWHRSHAHYAASKFNLLKNLSPEFGVAVMDATNDEVREKVKELKALSEKGAGVAYVPIGTKRGIGFDMRKACGARNSAFVDDGELLVAFESVEHPLCDASELRILGPHNQLNALAASAAAIAIGASDADVTAGLRSFEALEHRIEPAGTVQGVSYYNDSKATNVDATLVALSSFLPKKPIVMLGGDDKGTDLADLVSSCEANAKACICYGEAGQRFFDSLSPLSEKGVDVRRVGTFKDAFDAAVSMAGRGDIVLLSPACASFDEFSCFEERGERFKEYVGSLDR